MVGIRTGCRDRPARDRGLVGSGFPWFGRAGTSEVAIIRWRPWLFLTNTKDMTEEPRRKKSRLLAGIGLVIGLVALAAAFLSPNIAEAIDPPSPPIEEVAVDLASKLIDAAKAKAAGQRYQPAAATQELPSRFIYPVVVGLGMLAAALGVAALIRSEDRTMAGGAIALGVGAAFVQWSMMIVGALLVVFLVVAVIAVLSGAGF